MEDVLRQQTLFPKNLRGEFWKAGPRSSFKTAIILALMCLFAAHSGILEFFEPRRWRMKRRRAMLIHRYAKSAARVLGLDIQVQGMSLFAADSPRLFVGNHLSYLDVLVIAAQKPVLFVTSREIRETPFLGALTVLAGCLFVERRSRAQLPTEIREVRDALIRGFNVVIFPEATSTCGAEVLRFRRPLFRAAVEAERMVRPFCINYRSIDGEVINQRNRDVVCWYGRMPFLPHLYNLAKTKQVKIDLHWLSDLEVDDTVSEAALAEAAHSSVTSKFISTSPSL